MGPGGSREHGLTALHFSLYQNGVSTTSPGEVHETGASPSRRDPHRTHPGAWPAKGARDMQFFGNSRVKWPYATHLVDPERAKSLVPMVDGHDPGSLVLARVLSLSRHRELESHDGRRVMLFPGDVFVGVLGDRYATDQYLAF